MFVFDAPVLGIPVRFEVDDARLAMQIENAFGFWEAIVCTGAGGPALTLELRVDSRVAACEVTPRVQGSVLKLSGPGVDSVADRVQRTAGGSISVSWLDRPESLRRQILEALVLFMISGERRVPVHASCAVHSGTAAILLGNAGSGKTTLSYACGTRGLGVLSEDIVYADLESGSIWGGVSRFHLGPEAAGTFPELSGADPVVIDGERRLVITPPDKWRAAVPVSDAVICSLWPGHESVGFEQIESDAVVERLRERSEPGFDIFRAEAATCIERLSKHAAYRIRLSSDVLAAARAVRDILAIHTRA